MCRTTPNRSSSGQVAAVSRRQKLGKRPKAFAIHNRSYVNELERLAAGGVVNVNQSAWNQLHKDKIRSLVELTLVQTSFCGHGLRWNSRFPASMTGNPAQHVYESDHSRHPQSGSNHQRGGKRKRVLGLNKLRIG